MMEMDAGELVSWFLL